MAPLPIGINRVSVCGQIMRDVVYKEDRVTFGIDDGRGDTLPVTLFDDLMIRAVAHKLVLGAWVHVDGKLALSEDTDSVYIAVTSERPCFVKVGLDSDEAVEEDRHHAHVPAPAPRPQPAPQARAAGTVTDFPARQQPAPQPSQSAPARPSSPPASAPARPNPAPGLRPGLQRTGTSPHPGAVSPPGRPPARPGMSPSSTAPAAQPEPEQGQTWEENADDIPF